MGSRRWRKAGAAQYGNERRQFQQQREKFQPAPQRASPRVSSMGDNLSTTDDESCGICQGPAVMTMTVGDYPPVKLCVMHLDSLRNHLAVQKYEAAIEERTMQHKSASASEPLSRWLNEVERIFDKHAKEQTALHKSEQRHIDLVAQYRDARLKRRSVADIGASPVDFTQALNDEMTARTKEELIPKMWNASKHDLETKRLEWSDVLHHELCALSNQIDRETETRLAAVGAEFSRKCAEIQGEREAVVEQMRAVSLERGKAIAWFEQQKVDEWYRRQVANQQDIA